jgi:hypothetical protein
MSAPHAREGSNVKFQHEARWMAVIYLVLPLVGILLAIVIPGVLRGCVAR